MTQHSAPAAPVVARLDDMVLDAADIAGLADFYLAVTGWSVERRDDDWITLEVPTGPALSFQLAPDHVAPVWPGQDLPQQVHLDLLTADPEAAAATALSSGARRLADGPTWITMADPAGHPFDLCARDGVGPTMELFAVTIDAPDAAALARFYADLLGSRVGHEGPEGAMLDGAPLMFQQVADYAPPRWPDPAAPQQGHLDLIVDDLDAGEARALDLGATRLPGGERTFRVFADPAGHPFCLCVP